MTDNGYDTGLCAECGGEVVAKDGEEMRVETTFDRDGYEKHRMWCPSCTAKLPHIDCN